MTNLCLNDKDAFKMVVMGAVLMGRNKEEKLNY